MRRRPERICCLAGCACTLLGALFLGSCRVAPKLRHEEEQSEVIQIVLAETGVQPLSEEQLRLASKSELKRVRLRAARALERLRIEADPPGHLLDLKADLPLERRAAVLQRGRQASQEGSAWSSAPLCELLSQETDERVRWAIAWALAQSPADSPQAFEALSALIEDPSFLTASFAIQGLANGPPLRVRELVDRLESGKTFWIVREAVGRTLDSWQRKSLLAGGDLDLANAALARYGPLAPPLMLKPPPEERAPRAASDPELLRSLVRRGLRNPKAIVRIAGRGEIVLELFVLEAPLHVAGFISRAAAGSFDGKKVAQVDPLVGALISIPVKTAALPDETWPCPISRGSLISPEESPGELLFTYLPLPAFEGRLTVWGRVALGMETLDRVRPGDVIERVLALDAQGRPLPTIRRP